MAAQQAQHKVLLQVAAAALKVAPLEVPHRAAALLAETARLKTELAAGSGADEVSVESLLDSATLVGEVKLIALEVALSNANRLRQLIDQLRRDSGPAAVLLATCTGGKVVLVAGVSRELEERGMHAGNWVREVAGAVDGRGGGKPSMAQAGGTSPEKLPDALALALRVAHGTTRRLGAAHLPGVC